jgi:acetyl esterase/lipase
MNTTKTNHLMKIAASFFCVLLALSFSSCTPEKVAQPSVVSGKVNVTWSNTVNLRQGTVSLAESWANQTDQRDSIISLNDDGSFQVRLQLNEPKLYSLSHERKKVEFILTPGDSIRIDLSADTIFSGTHAAQNNHLNAMNTELNAIERFVVSDERSFFSAPLSQYTFVADSLENAYLNVHQKFAASNELPKVFDEKIKNEIKYRTQFHKIIYPSIHEMYTNDTLAINQSFFDNITQGSFENPELLELDSYVLFLERYVEIMSAGDLRFRNFYDAGIQKIHPKYNAIKALPAHQEIKDYLMNEHLKKSISNYGVGYLDDIISDYKETSKNPVLKQQILDLYEENVTRRSEPDTIKIYKTLNNIELEAHIFYPEGHNNTDKAPVYAFFHGGGWAVGIPEWGYTNCKRYQDKGMVSISFEYRLIDIHGSNIINCIEDVNSAILWIRQNAGELGIDPNKIVAAGFSAGGHLATATATLDGFTLNEDGFNSKPNAFVAHSASYNTTKSSFFRRQSNGNAETISTFHNAKKGMPPAILFHGTNDHLAPINEFTEFRDKMEALNNDFDYKIFQNVGHFFGDSKASEEVRELTDQFLQKLGYIQ